MSGKALKGSSLKVYQRGTVKTHASTPVPTITIINRQRAKRINTGLLKQTALSLFEELNVQTAELGINLVGAKEMANVNWRYLQHEGSTDVITFDHLHSSFEIRHSKVQLHGELFICVDDAVKQAKEFKTTWQSELVRYVVHGVLHLLGYDDLKADLRRKMKREENRLVRKLEKGLAFARL